MSRTLAASLVILALASVIAGCAGSRDDGPGSSDGPAGLSVAQLRAGEDGDCPFTDDLRDAMDRAGMPSDIEPRPNNEVAYQDERDDDSADSTILGDTDGAHLLCKFDMGEDSVELDTYYLGDPTGRTEFRDAVAWQLILGGVSENQVDDAKREYGDRLSKAEPGFAVEIPDQFGPPGDIPAVMAIVRGSYGGTAAIALDIQTDDPSVTKDTVEVAVHDLALRLSR